ncbi:MAG TPA: hypothetical protein PKW90_08885 [Myxococcota bacterium]|nr:hypothetical protein [Myxococcota bacterium]
MCTPDLSSLVDLPRASSWLYPVMVVKALLTEVMMPLSSATMMASRVSSRILSWALTWALNWVSSSRS